MLCRFHLFSSGFRYQRNIGLKVSWEVLPPLLFLEEFEKNWLLTLQVFWQISVKPSGPVLLSVDAFYY